MPFTVNVKGNVEYKKLHPQAHAPYKERNTDIGWDITLVGRVDNRAEDTVGDVNMYNTGISIIPPAGYYLDLVARSSLHKHGYMLVTGTSIIDPEYRGEILVPLFKFREGEDLELPFRAVQIILRPACYTHLSHYSGIMGPTSRGDRGFGSTGHGAPQQPPATYSREDYDSHGSIRQTAPKTNYMF